jgi:hypothetical protein
MGFNDDDAKRISRFLRFPGRAVLEDPVPALNYLRGVY